MVLLLLQLLWEDFYIFTLNFGQLTGLGLSDPDLMLNVMAAAARISLNKTEAEYQFSRFDFYPSIPLPAAWYLFTYPQPHLTFPLLLGNSSEFSFV